MGFVIDHKKKNVTRNFLANFFFLFFANILPIFIMMHIRALQFLRAIILRCSFVLFLLRYLQYFRRLAVIHRLVPYDIIIIILIFL